jgi:hypothetical protein
MKKVKRGFYEILWLMCEKENLLIKWVMDGYLIKNKNTYFWTPKAMSHFDSEILGTLNINEINEPVELSDITYNVDHNDSNDSNNSISFDDNIRQSKRVKKVENNITLNENQLEEFLHLFGRKNIGIPGKTTPKVTVVKKLLKFFKDYPDYTMSDIIEATKLYIANLKKQGSIRFIRECGYFISKKIDGVDQSDLAKWCEEYKQGGQNYTDYSSHTLL